MQTFRISLQSGKIWKPEDIDIVFRECFSAVKPVKCKGVSYYNAPVAFDIETSFFYKEKKKTACMYCWQFALNGAVIMGRHYDEFVKMLDRLADLLKTDEKTRVIIYVHNLAYEFQFIRKWLTFTKVFALDTRKPLYAITDRGIEFRCSYLLSGYSLAKLGEELQRYKVQKMVGDLDYNLLRHSGTPLTEKEIGYCVNDVKVLSAYIREQIEDHHRNIGYLPLTNTGRVRNFCRNRCFYEQGEDRKKSRKRQKYREIVGALTLTVDEYHQLKRAFQGGFTHANAFYVPFELNGEYFERVETDVTSLDFTSSYPAVMVAEQFPMSRAEEVEIKSTAEFEKNLRLYCCLFDVEITGLRSSFLWENYISESRCSVCEGATVNNGRIASADRIVTTITEQDWQIIKATYKWDKVRVGRFRRYQKAYLPTDFVKAILELYHDKTALKGVAEKVVEYLRSKGMLNSAYGMAVTDILREIIEYGEDWLDPVDPDAEAEIEKYNRNPGRFLFYPWGVWVTAYARRNLWTGIMECGPDYIYSDTDSVKMLHYEKHKDYVKRYNDTISRKLLKACEYHGINPEAVRPKTVKGEEKPLGVWDYDGHYQRFKTLGAKRYMVQTDDGKINITVAGLNKRVTVPYLIQPKPYQHRSADQIFRSFSDGLYIPAGYTGKNTHTYIDDEVQGEITDYLGNRGTYHEKSFIHLEESDYDMSISREYRDFIIGLEREEQSI